MLGKSGLKSRWSLIRISKNSQLINQLVLQDVLGLSSTLKKNARDLSTDQKNEGLQISSVLREAKHKHAPGKAATSGGHPSQTGE